MYDVFVEHVRVPDRGLDVGVIERLLHELEVAGPAQQLRPEIVPEVVRTEVPDACVGQRRIHGPVEARHSDRSPLAGMWPALHDVAPHRLARRESHLALQKSRLDRRNALARPRLALLGLAPDDDGESVEIDARLD